MIQVGDLVQINATHKRFIVNRVDTEWAYYEVKDYVDERIPLSLTDGSVVCGSTYLEVCPYGERGIVLSSHPSSPRMQLVQLKDGSRLLFAERCLELVPALQQLAEALQS